MNARPTPEEEALTSAGASPDELEQRQLPDGSFEAPGVVPTDVGGALTADELEQRMELDLDPDDAPRE